MMEQTTIFADSGIPAELMDNLRRFNPWWEEEAMPLQQSTVSILLIFPKEAPTRK